MVVLPHLRPVLLAVFGRLHISDEPENCRTYRSGGPSIPLTGIEWINIIGNVLSRGKRHLVEAVDVNYDVELRTQGEEIIQNHQLLRLLVAVGGEVDNDKV